MGKVTKVVNQAKLAAPTQSEPLWWEKIKKVVNKVNFHSKSFCATLVEKDQKSCESGKIGHSESF